MTAPETNSQGVGSYLIVQALIDTTCVSLALCEEGGCFLLSLETLGRFMNRNASTGMGVGWGENSGKGKGQLAYVQLHTNLGQLLVQLYALPYYSICMLFSISYRYHNCQFNHVVNVDYTTKTTRSLRARARLP